MRILKKPDDQDPLMIAKKKALEGCYKCPFCGEDQMIHPAQTAILRNEPYHNEGIAWIDYYYIYRLFKVYQTEVFKCYTCGAEWESEPYFIKYRF